MDARIIPFPARPGGGPQVPLAVGSGPVPQGAAPVGQACAEIALRLFDLDEPGGDLTGAVLAAAEATAEAGADLTGTPAHPMIEATLRGFDADWRAAMIALDADRYVRRLGAGRVVVCGAIATGHLVQVQPGVTRRVGAASARALAEKASPGQILLAGASWARDPRLEVVPARASATDDVFVLRGLR